MQLIFVMSLIHLLFQNSSNNSRGFGVDFLFRFFPNMKESFLILSYQIMFSHGFIISVVLAFITDPARWALRKEARFICLQFLGFPSESCPYLWVTLVTCQSSGTAAVSDDVLHILASASTTSHLGSFKTPWWMSGSPGYTLTTIRHRNPPTPSCLLGFYFKYSSVIF